MMHQPFQLAHNSGCLGACLSHSSTKACSHYNEKWRCLMVLPYHGRNIRHLVSCHHGSKVLQSPHTTQTCTSWVGTWVTQASAMSSLFSIPKTLYGGELSALAKCYALRTLVLSHCPVEIYSLLEVTQNVLPTSQ